MKNILLSISLFLLASSFVYTQSKSVASDFKVVWGAPYEIPKKYEDKGYFGNMNDGIVQISMKPEKEMIIQRFDPTKLALTKQDNIDITKMPSGFIADLFTMHKGKFYMFYSIWDKPRKKEQLFVQQIDIIKGSLSGTAQMLIEADKIVGEYIQTSRFSVEKANKYNFKFSIDSTKLLVTYKKIPVEKRDAINKDIYGFYVFDKNFNVVWNNEFKMPYTETMMDNSDFCVDTKGNAYMLCKVYEGEKRESKNDAPNYHYEVFKIEKGITDIKQIQIKLDNKFVNDVSITENLQGQMICAGYYRSDKKSNSTDGAFMVKIGDTNELSVMNKGFYEFPAETLKEFEKSRTQNKIEKEDKNAEAEVSNLELRKIVLNKDGSTMFIGEQYLLKVITRTYSSGNGQTSSTTTYKHYYGDVYIMKIDPLGDIEWVKKIPKNQVGVNGRGGMSFLNFNYEGDNYFLYLDNLKNLNLTSDKAPAEHQDGFGGFLTVCKLDNNGNLTKGKLFDIREKDVQIWPAEFSIISPNIIIGRSYSEKLSKMMKLTLKP
ncbi:MAG: hypothetical protein A2033_03740 [Bacteroidetes bacterium GWA2_31_9]|nr:MAG: hypothetical protein A2033_03740 [Bacteroidetes bacterium GWA2_31_9]